MNRPAIRYFTIFGAMRTGSNLLERTLSQYPDIEGYGELYNRQFIGKPTQKTLLGMDIAAREADPIKLLNNILASTDQIIGFRIFGDHDPRMIDYTARDPRCAKIILTRDPIDSFISLKIATKTGQWMLSKEENRRLAKAHFDAQEYQDYHDRLKAHYAHVRHIIRAEGGAAFEISYPELTNPDIMSGAARFAGATGDRPDSTAPILRQNPPDRKDKVENYGDLQAYLGLNDQAATAPAQVSAPKFIALDEMVVARRHNLIYAPIPGAGAAEVKRILSETEGAASGGGIANGLKSLHVTRRKRRGGLVFTFVRHPATRLVDVFLRKVLKPQGRVFDDLAHLLTISYKAPPLTSMRNDAKAQKAGFSAFLTFIQDNLAGRTAMPVDPSWAPQTDLLRAYCDETPVDFIGRVESITTDATYVLGRAGVENPDQYCAKLASRMGQFADAGALERLLTSAAENHIYSVYAKDYDSLGYSALNKGVSGDRDYSVPPIT